MTENDGLCTKCQKNPAAINDGDDAMGPPVCCECFEGSLKQTRTVEGPCTKCGQKPAEVNDGYHFWDEPVCQSCWWDNREAEAKKPLRHLCQATLVLGDDFGDNSATFRCDLPLGHGGNHIETFHRESNRTGEKTPVTVTWVEDETCYREDYKEVVLDENPGMDFCEHCARDLWHHISRKRP